MKSDFFNKLFNLFSPKKLEEEKDYLENILDEYKNKYPSYEEFRLIIHKTTEALLKENKYKYQISSRTKTPDRLKEKLIRKKEEGRYYNSLEEVEDLVGVRVIFYTEYDKEAFIKEIKKEISGLIKLEEKVKNSGYHATHIIVSFGPKRLQLSEYQHFHNFKSEIQITSIFHHAWAEIEHDLIYKDIHGLKKQNPEKFKAVKQKIHQIMEKYIKKVTEELEEIIN